MQMADGFEVSEDLWVLSLWSSWLHKQKSESWAGSGGDSAVPRYRVSGRVERGLNIRDVGDEEKGRRGTLACIILRATEVKTRDAHLKMPFGLGSSSDLGKGHGAGFDAGSWCGHTVVGLSDQWISVSSSLRGR